MFLGHASSSTPRENISSKPVQQSPPTSPTSKLQALEQLQYQLTARELQYAQRGLVSSPQPKSTGDVIQTTVPVENIGLPVPGPRDSKPQTNVSSDHVSPWQPSFSSAEHSSLKEVWKLLDDGTPVVTPREDDVVPLVSEPFASNLSSSGGFRVKGRHSNIQTKPGAQKQALSKKAAGKWKPVVQPKAKIRNYNIKDQKT